MEEQTVEQLQTHQLQTQQPTSRYRRIRLLVGNSMRSHRGMVSATKVVERRMRETSKARKQVSPSKSLKNAWKKSEMKGEPLKVFVRHTRDKGPIQMATFATGWLDAK